jgi:predicted RNase H-like HicB family nuclease
MKQKFMVIYEHGTRNYGGFAPDIAGAGSLGKNLHETRRMMKESLESHLALMAGERDEMPRPVATNFDFGEIRDESVDHYVVEWLEIEVPATKAKKTAISV